MVRWATSPSAEGLTRQPITRECGSVVRRRRSLLAKWDGERGTERGCQRMRVIYTAIRRYVAELNRMQDVGRGLSTYKGERVGR